MLNSDKNRPASPELLVADKSLSQADKEKMLSQWKLDLELELNAADENMPATDSKAKDENKSELLRRVNNCLLNLKEAA